MSFPLDLASLLSLASQSIDACDEARPPPGKVVLRFAFVHAACTGEATAQTMETKWSKLEAAALRDLVPDAFPAPAPAPVRDDEEVMPTRKKRGYVTLSDRAPRPSAPLNESSSDDEVMPTKKRRGPPKKRN